MMMTRWLACGLFSLAALSLLSLQGCSLIGGLAQAFAPPEFVPARYDLPDKRTLIVVEDRQQLIEDQGVPARIAATARAALEAEQVVSPDNFVTQAELSAYRAELGEAFGDKSLAGLGLALGARQVIHAEVAGYQMDIGGDLVRPAIALNVKVFDLDERRRVFPSADAQTGVESGEAVYPVLTKGDPRNLSNLESARAGVRRELADLAGRDLGRLFFDWRKPKPGTNVER